MISQSCPAPHGDRLVAPLLDLVDCQIAYYVEETYAALFGPFGAFEPVLTAALTIYIAIYGYQLLTGRGSLSLSGLAPKILLIGLVLAFATRWGAYQTVFVGFVYGGADQLAALMATGNGRASLRADIATARLDSVLQEIIRLASTWNDGAINGVENAPAAPAVQDIHGQNAPIPAPPLSNAAVNLLWFSAIVFALSTIGVMIIAKVLLGLLLAAGPILLVMALFSATRGFFEGWLRSLAMYGFIPVFATVLAAAALHIVEPLLIQIRNLHALGEPTPQPVFVLALVVFIFALLVMQVFRMCARLTSSLKLPNAGRALERPSAGAVAVDANRPQRNDRVAEMVVAVEQAGAARADRRVQTISGSYGDASGFYNSATLANRHTRQRYRSLNKGRADELQRQGFLA